MKHPVYAIQWHRKAVKAFRDIKDQKLKDHVLYAVEYILAPDPLSGKVLCGPFKGVFSYRIGVIRILYEIYRDRLIIVILDIGHRREIYR